ncbi:hydantoinase/oxoprolinase family protein [Rhodococcus opacus]|uniref:hydantoinase/oxoprolinase family protein n=1 Tax=Rhodococcus opacus TaxID=37919 RepID=UPI0029498C32|nr:hydantoinase/oxoprolinase family protein [Rhodococcus opacus]MDV6247193.1 hydantoinase/oxoprolinase family protein [Rhodococcus opacus]
MTANQNSSMFAVDVGGTFTDVVAVTNGNIETAKISTNYGAVYDSVLEGARTLGLDDAARVFNHASTHGLNAVITRNLPKIGVLVTEGHRDILDHGTVGRPGSATLDPTWRRSFGDASRPLVERYLRRGIKERITASGEVLFPLDEEQARAELAVLARCGVQGVAIGLMHAYANDAHEVRLRELVHEVLGDVPVSVSSAVSPLAQEYARLSTTVIDTFMKLIFTDYIASLEQGLEKEGFTGQLNFADCAATLVPSTNAMEQPFRIVFAGPAAGTVASAHFGAGIGEHNLLCADVGGTSCDISLVRNGEPSLRSTFELEHDLVVNALASDVTAIGAGGGSLVTIGLAGEIVVGPGSAGSTPGPACYGKGGIQPTTTDTCLMIGIIDPGTFADGKIDLDADLSRKAFEALECTFTLEERVRHAYEMGVNNLAEGIFNVAIKNGADPREFSLVAYGAAGPMLLPATLDLIKAKQVVVPPHPGLFSALGLLSTEQTFATSRSAYTMLSADSASSIDRTFTEMEESLRASVGDQDVVFTRSFDGRLAGQTWDTAFVAVPDGTIDEAGIAQMVANFHDAYQQNTGIRFDALPVEGITYGVQARVPSQKVSYPTLPTRDGEPLIPCARTQMRYLYDEPRDVPVYNRSDLLAGDRIEGPAIVRERLSTTHLCDNQLLTVGNYGELVITRLGEKDFA